jgi:hypothetical protein
MLDYGKASGKTAKEREYKDRLHFSLWRYSRDGMLATNTLRARMVVTGAMTGLWAAIFAVHVFGAPQQVAYGVVGVVLAAFAVFAAFFEVKVYAHDHRHPIPVTVVTGWLGAGKTTLITQLLKNTRGLQILVVENEIGAVGVDHDLLVDSAAIGQEEVVLLRNGCVCCSVRADLGRVLREQLARTGARKGWFGFRSASAFDAIVVETTGVAQPSPIIQLFFADAAIRRQATLDAVTCHPSPPSNTDADDLAASFAL